MSSIGETRNHSVANPIIAWSSVGFHFNAPVSSPRPACLMTSETRNCILKIHVKYVKIKKIYP